MYKAILLMPWLKACIFSYNLPSPLLVASTLVVTLKVGSTMILGLGMGGMGLCSICNRRHFNEKLQIKREVGCTN
jgi:hypothetical protein